MILGDFKAISARFGFLMAFYGVLVWCVNVHVIRVYVCVCVCICVLKV